jgi:ribonucleoside-diphosphate reductase beta chain/ribonucleoside-diphosphate reductase subunit M2
MVIENNTKYCFLPVKNHKLNKYYEVLESEYWRPSELNLKNDRDDWNSLEENEATFLEFWLAFFAQFDGLVSENLMSNFQNETSFIKEARNFYAAQNMNETIHNKTYSLMIDTFIEDPNKKNKMLNAIDNYLSIKKIADWIKKWMDPTLSIKKRIIAFICLEGILFQGAFCAVYWFKKKNKLRGLCKSNEWISRDEAVHTSFGAELYNCIILEYLDELEETEPNLSSEIRDLINKLRVSIGDSKGEYNYDESIVDELREFKISCLNKIYDYLNLPQKDVHEIVSSCLDVAEEFTRESLRVELLDMKSEEMIEYQRCCADCILEELGYEKLYEAENPFPWMLMISLFNKTNFFEDEVSEYVKINDKNQEFTINAEY